MFVFVCVPYLFVCLFVCLCAYFCLFVCLFGFFVCVRLSVFLFVCLFVDLFTCLCLFICLNIQDEINMPDFYGLRYN